jgi:hypothetical protein
MEYNINNFQIGNRKLSGKIASNFKIPTRSIPGLEKALPKTVIGTETLVTPRVDPLITPNIKLEITAVNLEKKRRNFTIAAAVVTVGLGLVLFYLHEKATAKQINFKSP